MARPTRTASSACLVAAAAATRGRGTLAFTVGQLIDFRCGPYAPGSSARRRVQVHMVRGRGGGPVLAPAPDRLARKPAGGHRCRTGTLDGLPGWGHVALPDRKLAHLRDVRQTKKRGGLTGPAELGPIGRTTNNPGHADHRHRRRRTGRGHGGQPDDSDLGPMGRIEAEVDAMHAQLKRRSERERCNTAVRALMKAAMKAGNPERGDAAIETHLQRLLRSPIARLKAGDADAERVVGGLPGQEGANNAPGVAYRRGRQFTVLDVPALDRLQRAARVDRAEMADMAEHRQAIVSTLDRVLGCGGNGAAPP